MPRASKPKTAVSAELAAKLMAATGLQVPQHAAARPRDGVLPARRNWDDAFLPAYALA
jgi:hypothetical protein